MKDTVQDTASLHEKAVQAIASGEVDPMPKRKRKASQKRSQPVHTHIKLDPRVLAQVELLLLKTSYTRYEIISDQEAIVR